MKLETLQEAKYVNPKIEQLKKVLDDNKPKEGYLIKWRDGDDVYTIERIHFQTDEEGDFIAVTFVEKEDWVSFDPQELADGIEIYQMKRIG